MIAIDEIWPGWRAEEKIGEGACGAVYRVSKTELGHTSYAAAKFIEIPQGPAEIVALRDQGMNELSIKSYFEGTAKDVINEIALMESLKGAKNIVGIEDYRLIEHDDGIGWTVCIRMELLQSVADVYQRSTPTVSETVKMGIDICSALESCEELGIIHRDVKPENAFIDKFGTYKLGDFGIARRIENASRSVYSQKGTIPYMAPEIVHGRKYGKSVDEYSLGIMLYRYLNRRRYPFYPPAPQQFDSNDVENAQVRRLRGERIPAPVDADPALASIVCKACEADPRKRYQSAHELRADLEAYQRGDYGGAEVRGGGVASGPGGRKQDLTNPEGKFSRTKWGTKVKGTAADSVLAGVLAASVVVSFVSFMLTALWSGSSRGLTAGGLVFIVFLVEMGIVLYTMSKYHRQVLVSLALVVLAMELAFILMRAATGVALMVIAGEVLAIITLVILLRGVRRTGQREL